MHCLLLALKVALIGQVQNNMQLGSATTPPTEF